MNAQNLPRKKSGQTIRFFGEKNEVTSWGFTVSSRQSSRRFLQAVQSSIAPLGGKINAAPNLLGVLAARLVCLDGVRPESLQWIDLEKSPPYQMFNWVAIEWQEPASPRLERRILSPLTGSAWRTFADSIVNTQKDAKNVLQEPSDSDDGHPNQMQEALIAWLADRGLYAGERNPLFIFGEDQLCWHAEILPGTLFAHCAARFPLSALPRSCWARLEMRRALKTIEADADPNAHEESAILSLADWVCEVEGTQVDVLLLQSALDILGKTHPSNSDGLTKRLWVSELEKLSFHQSSTNPQTVVLVGWLIYMCEYGTLHKRDVSVSTIRTYAQRTLMKLARLLTKFESLQRAPEEWPPKDLEEVYVEVIESNSSGNRPVCTAALASFQRYLEDTFETDILQEYIHRADGDYIPSVAADVLWNHEIDWCIESCSSASDKRIGDIANVMLSIARECPVRYQDLSRMTLRNVAFGQDSIGRFCELEVARDAYRGRLKTESAQRRLLIKSQSAIELIQQWYSVRREEGAPLDAYLFGDPADDKKRYRHTAVQAFLNRLVKSASGTSTMKFHSLRHSVISRRTAEILSSSPIADVIPIEVSAAAAGHASPITTLRSYSHIYEQALRMWLDLGLRELRLLSAFEMAATLTEAFPSGKPVRPNTLVQSAKRRNLPLQHHWWLLLDKHAIPADLEHAAHPFTWSEPTALIPCVHRNPTISIPAMADVLIRLSKGAPYSTVARIHGIPDEQIRLTCERLDRWLHEVYREHYPHLSRREDKVLTLYERLTKMHIDLQGMLSPTWSGLSLALSKGMDEPTATGAIAHWATYGRGIYVPLVPTQSTRPLIRLLRYGEVDRDHIRAIIQSSNSVKGITPDIGGHHIDTNDHVLDSIEKSEVAQLFEEEMRIEPLFEFVGWRCDRPMSYLQINSHRAKARTAGRSDQSGSLKAWLIAIKAHQFLTSGKATNG